MSEAIATFDRLSAPFDAALSYEYLARLDVQFGDNDAAVADYREALRRYEQIGSPYAEEVRAALRRLGAEP